MDLNSFTVLDPRKLLKDGVNLKHNWYATVDPTTSDNVSLGYTNGSGWINTLTDRTWRLVDEAAGTWKELGGSTAADTEMIKVDFTYNTASPLTIFVGNVNDVLADCEVKISEAFNDNGAKLEVGTVASPDVIMNSQMIRPNKAALYGADQNYVFTISETVRLTITPGASTQGKGYVLIQVKRS